MSIKEYTSGEKADIVVNVDQGGSCEVTDFIEGLDDSDQRKVLHLFEMFCEQGQIRNEEKFNHEDGPIYAFKSFQVRILCAFLPGRRKRTVILLYGLKKKQDKLPKPDLKKAQLLYDNIVKSK
ncbi:MAG: type II toxin-antitoxin system RelE/ParE family toxin [Candidatus Kryptoniota bacterium]